MLATHLLQARPRVLTDGLEPPRECLPLLLPLGFVLGPPFDPLSSVFRQRNVFRPWLPPCRNLKLREATVRLNQLDHFGQALSDGGVEVAGERRLQQLPDHQPRAAYLRSDLGVAQRRRTGGVSPPLLGTVRIMVPAVS